MSETGEDVPLWVWIGLTIIAGLSFYCQAAVTEERFVPALSLIADEFKIPNDVAGATLMAAGASSPELFSSIVSLFITHSALGLGTIVGSEIFNQLIICAGAIFAAKSGYLELDKAIVTREVFFYALSIALLIFALHDIEPSDDDELGEEHIFISFFDACVVFCAYLAYVLVCSNFEAVVNFMTCKKKPEIVPFSEKSKRISMSFLDDIPFLQTFSHDPEANFTDKLCITKGGERRLLAVDERTSLLRSSTIQDTEEAVTHLVRSSSLLEKSIGYTLGKFSDGGSMRMFHFLVNDEKPSDQRDLLDMEVNAFEEGLSCFLWQRSYFYNNSKFAKKGWNLRWFTFGPNFLHSVPDRANAQNHLIIYPRFEEIEADDKRLIIRILHPDPKRRNYYLMAPDREIFEAVVKKFEAIIDATKKEDTETRDRLAAEQADFPSDGESEGSLLDFPHGGSNLAILLHIILFPLKALMHYTIPDVRVSDVHGEPTASLSTGFLAIFMCLVWLVVGSYAMVASLERLADLMGIPDAVVGVTVAAAGTSLPNYVASKVAAERGFGNMAVSNAFGSNTFNIMVGLGFPWVLYTSFGTNFKPYHGLRNEGILESVIVLSIVLAVFIVNVLLSGFKLYKWHGILYIALYVGYLAFAIIPVYVH